MNIDARFVPLEHWPRKFTSNRRRSQFDSSYSQTLDKLKGELSKLGARNVVIQVALDPRDIRRDGWPRADARRPKHPGVVVSFDSRHGPLSYVCDAFFDWEDNLRGIAMTLERLRLVDLYGVTSSGEQYKGWAALPAPDGDVTTVEQAATFIERYSGISVISIKGDAVEFRSAYRAAARKLHPDVGGDTIAFQRLQSAHDILKKHHGI